MCVASKFLTPSRPCRSYNCRLGTTNSQIPHSQICIYYDLLPLSFLQFRIQFRHFTFQLLLQESKGAHIQSRPLTKTIYEDYLASAKYKLSIHKTQAYSLQHHNFTIIFTNHTYTMALKDRFRRAISRKDFVTSTSPTSSGFTTPALSRTPSREKLPALTHSSTSPSLRLTKTTSSGFSLRRFRSNKSEFERHAPKNYRFQVADPLKVATLNAWDWNAGNSRGSVSSICSGICPMTPA